MFLFVFPFAAKQKETLGKERTLHPLRSASESHLPRRPDPPGEEKHQALARPLSRTISATGSECGYSDPESPSKYVHGVDKPSA